MKTSISLPDQIKEAAQAQAKLNGTTLSAVMETLLTGWLADHVHSWHCQGCGSTLDTQAAQDRTAVLEAQYTAARDEIHRLREAVTGLQAGGDRMRAALRRCMPHLISGGTRALPDTGSQDALSRLLRFASLPDWGDAPGWAEWRENGSQDRAEGSPGGEPAQPEPTGAAGGGGDPYHEAEAQGALAEDELVHLAQSDETGE